MQDTPPRDAVFFVPLGGTGEVGMNAYAYGHDGRWLLVDLGIGFADERHPGVDLLVPDVTFLAERRAALDGLVVTHAHEDHLGAIAHLWPQLGCPVYATPFACAILRRKLQEAELLGEVELIEVTPGTAFTVGVFALEFIALTHSIPEAQALRIQTKAGTVLHSGDWKLDPDPLVGDIYDHRRLARLRNENILALVGDSTNALVAGHSGSEAEVRGRLIDLVSTLEKRVVITCFATNAARVATAGKVAEATGRRLCLVGRSMRTIVQAAQEVGYLADLPLTIEEAEAADLPRNEVLLLATGSQGEPRAALPRMARGDHPNLDLDAGDTVIFSSRIIPGNEKAIHAVQNQLLYADVSVVTEEDHHVHVTGHPCQEELIQMYDWVRPQIAVPMHGEPRHLIAHAALARRCQVPHVQVPQDGQCLRFDGDGVRVLGTVPAARLAVEGDGLAPLDRGPVRERRKLSYEGAAVVTVVLDVGGAVAAPPQVTALGLLPADEAAARELRAKVADTVERALSKLRPRDRRDDSVLRETVRVATRRSLQHLAGRKPMTTVHLVRLD